MQRAGKTHRAALSDNNQDMKLKVFFRDCAEILNEADDEAAFYFEQLVEHMISGKPLPSDKKNVRRILGV